MHTGRSVCKSSGPCLGVGMHTPLRSHLSGGRSAPIPLDRARHLPAEPVAGPHMAHSLAVHLPLGALLTWWAMCGTGQWLFSLLLLRRWGQRYSPTHSASAPCALCAPRAAQAASPLPLPHLPHRQRCWPCPGGLSDANAIDSLMSSPEGRTWCTPTPCTFPRCTADLVGHVWRRSLTPSLAALAAQVAPRRRRCAGVASARSRLFCFFVFLSRLARTPARAALPHRAPSTRCTADPMHHVRHRSRTTTSR